MTGKMLAEARSGGQRLETYPEDKPQTLQEAYATQQHMIAAMPAPVVGWKVGFTSDTARAAAGIAEPIFGPLFEDAVHDDDAVITVADNDLMILEPEIGFVMATDLPPRDEPYMRDDILQAIARVHPIFELVNKRLPGTLQETPEWLAADGAINQAIIMGAGQAFVPGREFVDEGVIVALNGADLSKGIGANAMGDPIAVLLWLANNMREKGMTLRAGDLVATGLLSDLIYCKNGDTCHATFDTLGSVTTRIIV